MRVGRGLDGRPLFDALLTCVVGALALAVAPWAVHWQPSRHPVDPLGYALIVAAVLPLLVRRRWPLLTLGLSTAALVAYLALRYPGGPVFLGPLVGVYTVGASLPVGRSLAAAVLTALALLAPFVAAAGPHRLLTVFPDLGWALAWVIVPWAVGAVLRQYRASRVHDREAEDRRRAYEQRLQIAREVHDVVGHGLAVINMQAGVALHVLDRRPEQAKLALEAIRQASKESLDELRSTLAVFRQPDGEARQPRPGLGQLEGLVTGGKAALPGAVDQAAYRIVQESLTNVVRHAGATSATVRVACEPGQVVVEVTDDGRARGGPGRRSGGHGIAGMRERAAALGGELEAGPRPEGGFHVRARLPLGATTS